MTNHTGVSLYWKLTGIVLTIALIALPTELGLVALCLLLVLYKLRQYARIKPS